MDKTAELYEGKAKKVFGTDSDGYYIVSYKDDATAFNGQKKGAIPGKGVVNNKMSNYLMRLIERDTGIPTHFVKELSDRETVVKRVAIVPLEVVVRNIAAGSFSARLGVPEGAALLSPTLEFCYKNDELSDPMVNDYHILACGWATRQEIDTISDYALRINDYLKVFFAGISIELVDIKLEFGRSPDGTIILADEISPDTCRFWDATTREKLDKDRFRRDLGGVEQAYYEMMKRVFGDKE